MGVNQVSFCGVVDATPERLRPGTIDHMIGSLPSGGQKGEFRHGNCEIVAYGGSLGSMDGVVAVLIGRPRWARSSLADLAHERGDAVAAITAFREHGFELLSTLRGEFAVAVCDLESGQCIVATDRFGRFPVFHALSGTGLLFGSTATAVRAVSPASHPVSPQSVYDYVYYHMVPAPGSIFTGIFKLQAAQQLEVHSPGKTRVNTYWLPTFSEDTSVTSQELRAELRDSIFRAVEDRLDVDDIGAFLSGGLDSSTVAGMLARARPEHAHTYSIGFPAEGYDEMDYARIAARHFGLDAHEYYVTPKDVVETLPRIASAYDEPFGNSSAVPAYICARLAAADGVKVMLAGDGGDEIFAGNARYAKQAIFELYYRMPFALRKNIVEPLAAHLPVGAPVLGKLKSYVTQARIPLPERLQSYNFLHRHSPAEIFSSDFLKQVDVEGPSRIQRDLYERPSGATSLNRMLYLDWQQTLADNDLRKVGRMCALAGVDVTYPLLDDRVVDLSCRIPSQLKLGKRNILRLFYKQAMDGFLPEAIIQKPKHGFGLPFGVWMRTDPALKDLAHSALTDLRGRGFFKEDFIARILTLHQDVHAAFYGELIWILTALELWFHAYGS